MNGRGYKRTGDFDEIIIRKRCRILDPAEVVGDTDIVGNLDVAGDITLTGTVDGVDVAALGASALLTDIVVSESGEKNILKPTDVAHDFEIRPGTGVAGVLIGTSTGSGTTTISADPAGADGAVILNVKNNKLSAFKIKSDAKDRVTLDTTTGAVCLESTGDMKAVDMIATGDMYVGDGATTAYIRAQDGVGNFEIRASNGGTNNPAVKLIPSSGSVVMEATGPVGRMILGGGNIEQSFYVKNTGGTVLLETDGDPGGVLSVNIPVLLNAVNVVATGNVSCATLTLGGDATTGFTSPEDASNLIAGSGSGGALTTGATNNTAIGQNCLTAVTTGDSNTCVGRYAGTVIGPDVCCNTCIGTNSGATIVGGPNNTCIGNGSGGGGLVAGGNNTCLGFNAQLAADYNNSTVIGANTSASAGNQATIGSSSTTELCNAGDGVCDLGSSGRQFKDCYLSGTVYCTALDVNGSGVEGFTNPVDDTNMVAGTTAGDSLTGGASVRNVLIGKNAGTALTTNCYDNTFVGYEAGKTAGASTVQNTFIGAVSGGKATGNNNTCVGDESGFELTTGTGNTIIGQGDGNITTGIRNTCIGSTTLPTAGSDYQIAIGYQATCGASEECCIGGINSGQSVTVIKPGRDDYTSLGDSSNRFTDLHLTGAVVDEIPAALTSSDSPYTMANTDNVIRCDTSTNLIQITLPDASTNNGKRYIIALETDPIGNDVTISRATTDTINGGTSTLGLVDAGSAWTVYAIGTNWYATATN